MNYGCQRGRQPERERERERERKREREGGVAAAADERARKEFAIRWVKYAYGDAGLCVHCVHCVR